MLGITQHIPVKETQIANCRFQIKQSLRSTTRINCLSLLYNHRVSTSCTRYSYNIAFCQSSTWCITLIYHPWSSCHIATHIIGHKDRSGLRCTLRNKHIHVLIRRILYMSNIIQICVSSIVDLLPIRKGNRPRHAFRSIKHQLWCRLLRCLGTYTKYQGQRCYEKLLHCYLIYLNDAKLLKILKK